jgi:hypothetical protein
LKSFQDPHIARIQRNAVRSWLKLEPTPAILVFGDAPGVEEHCAAFGLTRVREPLERVDKTAVRLRDMAVRAEAISDSQFYCYINGDIILTGSLTKAIPMVRSKFAHFFLGASPWNVEITEDLDFQSGWEQDLERRAREADDQRSRVSTDIFLYTKGFLANMPDLVIGRNYVDNGLMWYIRSQGKALVDGTPGIFTVHQHHDYRHLGDKAKNIGESDGALWNVRAVGGRNHLYTFANATDHYTEEGVRPYWAGRFTRWSTHLVAGSPRAKRFHSFWTGLAKWTGPFRRRLGLVNPRSPSKQGSITK